MEIIDNFLPNEEFKKIQQFILSYNFPWYFLDSKSSPSIPILCDDLNNYQFCHVLFDDENQTNNPYLSQYFPIVKPIIDHLSLKKLLKVKVNLNIKADKIQKYSFHTDNNNFNCKTSIYYLNTNNGYTVFENGDKVSSLENRILIFDSQQKHTGTTCTDQKFRSVINFNYF